MMTKFTFIFSFFCFSVFKSASAQSVFKPSDLSGLQLWFSADTGVVWNGLNVSNWSDRSTNNNNANQNTPINQSLYVNNVNIINNKPILRFGKNGNSGDETFLSFPQINIPPNNLTAIAVFKSTGIVNNLQYLIAESGGISAGGIAYPNTIIYDGGITVLQGNVLPLTYNIMTYYNDKMFKNGIQLPVSGSPIGAISFSTIGTTPGAPTNFFYGDIAEIIVYNTALTPTQREQVELYLNNKYAPPVNLGTDITANGFCPVKLNAHKDWFSNYQWSSGETTDSIFVNTGNAYSVTVTNIFGDTSSDTINVTYPGNLAPFPSTKAICFGDTLVWNTQLDKAGYDFLWQDGSTDSLFIITQEGQYSVTVTDTIGVAGCSISSYTLTITVDTFSQMASLGPDISICSGNSIALTQGATQAQNYLWSNGDTTSTIVIQTTGDYSVVATDVLGCVAKDTIHITIIGSAPTVNFNASVACEGKATQFTDMTIPASGIASWIWNFGDGSPTSSMQSPIHFFSDSGTFMVSLTVTTNAGCFQSFSNPLKIFPLPKSNFSNSIASVGGNTQFTDNSNSFGYPIASWNWNFDDTASGINNFSNLQNPVHQFAQNGNHNVKLIVQTTECLDSVIKPVFVYNNIPTSLAGLKLWYAADNGVYFNGVNVNQWNDISGNSDTAFQSNNSFRPQFVDTISVLNNKPIIRFGKNGNSGDETFLSFSQVNIPANNLTAIAVFKSTGIVNNLQYLIAESGGISAGGIAYPNTIIYDGGSTVLQGNVLPLTYNILTYYNDSMFKNGIQLPVSGSPIGAISFSTIGTTPGAPTNFFYGDIAEIIVYNTALTPTQREQVELYLNNKYAPPVNLGTDITANGFCPVKLNAHKDWFSNYQWSSGETTDSIFVNTGNAYSVTVTNIFGDTSSDTINVTYPGNLAPFPSTKAICFGDTLVWNTQLDKAGYDFLWQDGSTDSLFIITQEGQYSVTVTDTIGVAGCSISSYTLTITVDTFSQMASLGPDISICSGNSIALTQGATQAQNYLWSNGDTTSTIVIQTTGDYSVVATDVLGCVAKDTIHITIIGSAPTVNFNASVACEGKATQFTDMTIPASGIASWIWNFGDGSPTSSMQSPIHFFSDSGTFMVSLTVTTNAGCFQSFSNPLKIFPLPKSNFSNSIASVGGNTQFTDNSNSFGYPIASWNWNFDDTASGINNFSNLQNPVHQFAQNGNHNVKLIVQTTECLDSVIKPVFVYNNIPTSLAGLKLWYAADNGVYFNGVNVNQWNDISGNSDTAFQSNNSFRPQFVDTISVLNNKPIIRFGKNGNSGDETFLGFPQVNIPANNLTAIAVFKSTGIVNNLQYLIAESGGISAGGIAYPNTIIYDGGTTVLQGNVLPLTYNIMTYYNDKMFKNGIQLPVSGSPIGAISFSTIGTTPGSQTNFFYGDIAEIIVYDTALTQTQRQEVEKYLNEKYAPPVNLGPDISLITFCPDSLDASSRFTSFKWNKNANDTNQYFVFSKPGKYFVDVVDVFGFPSSDTVLVTYPLNQIDTSHLICSDSTLIWNTYLNNNDFSFLWNDSTTDSLILINQQGVYSVTATEKTSSCTFVSEAVSVLIDSFPLTTILGPPAISICSGNSIALIQGQNEATDYFWSDSSTGSSLVINTPGTYSLTVTNSNGCLAIDSVDVSIVGIAPTVKFSASDVCFEDSIVFMDSSFTNDGSNIISWLWNFGDGGSDSLKNTSHYYGIPGLSISTLTIQTDSGCANFKTDSVFVHALPIPKFKIANPKICSSDSINFNDLSLPQEGGITTWQWNFNDSASGTNNASTLTSPSHYFASGGDYNISLIIENSFGCADTLSKKIKISQKPSASFNVLPVCENQPVQFIDNSSEVVNNWDWDFGDGGKDNIGFPSHTYLNADTYIVSLHVKTIDGCNDTFVKSVIVYKNPVAKFSTINFCRGTPIQAMDKSTVAGGNIVAWEWDVLNHPDFSTEKNPFFNFDSSDASSYLLSLKVKSTQGCSGDTAIQIFIHNPPSSDFSFSSPYGNIPVTVNFQNLSSDSDSYYSWDFGNGNTSVLENPSAVYNDTGEFPVKLISYSQFGCSDEKSKKIKIRKEVLDIAVTKVSTSSSNNFMTVSAELYNLGNVKIKNFEIIAELSGRPPVKEFWTGALEEKRDTGYLFNAAFEITDNTIPDAVCVVVAKPNDQNDVNPTNNEFCISFSDFKILSVFPNPASKQIEVEYTLTGEFDEIEIVIYDKAGKKIEQFRSESGSKGLHKTILDVSSLSNGIYALKMVYGDGYGVRRFMKN